MRFTKILNKTLKIGDSTIELYPEYELAKNTITSAEVIAVSPQKKFKYSQGMPEWYFTIDIQPGDIAYVDYFTVLKTFGAKASKTVEMSHPAWFIGDDGGIYAFIRYDYVYFVLRKDQSITKEDEEYSKWFYDSIHLNIYYAVSGNKLSIKNFDFSFPHNPTDVISWDNNFYRIIMLNGYALCFAFTEKIVSKIILPPSSDKRRGSRFFFCVLNNSKDNGGYVWSNRYTDATGFNSLDIITALDFSFFPIEDGHHKLLQFGNNAAGVIQRRYIDSIVEVNNFDYQYIENS